MTLKTLKDFCLYKEPKGFPNVSSISLRQEAIKWIKELEHPSKSDSDGWVIKHESCNYWFECEDSYYSHCQCYVIKRWIKYFFNITEEELIPLDSHDRLIAAEKEAEKYLKD